MGDSERQPCARVITYEDSPGTAYIVLWDHPMTDVPGCVKTTISLHQLIKNYVGPRIAVDLDHNGRPIGIEVIYGIPDVEAHGGFPDETEHES